MPIVGDGIKGGKIAKKLNDFRKSLDAAGGIVSKSFNKTKATAAKYWDDIAKKNRKAYEEALKKCNGSKACKEKAALKKGPQYGNTPKSGEHGSWSSGERGDGVWTPKNGGPPVTYKNGFPDW